jgi:hypothetical protein
MSKRRRPFILRPYMRPFYFGASSAATPTAAAVLLGGEADGLAIDFTDMSMVIRDTTTPANNFAGDPNSKLTYDSPATKWVRNSAGVLVSGTTIRSDYDNSLANIGAWIEPAATNLALWCRDMTQTDWVKSNVTAAKDVTGADGTANGASRLTATADNGTCLQSITSASDNRTFSVFAKRISGSGDVAITQDNGGDWAGMALTNEWQRFARLSPSTETNPVVGFRLATSGDVVAVDFAQEEVILGASSPIATTTATVTRAVDTVTLATSLFPYKDTAGSIYAKYSITHGMSGVQKAPFAISDGTTNNRIEVFSAVGGGNWTYRMTRAGGAQVAGAGGVAADANETTHALAFTSNDYIAYLNGASDLTDTSLTLPTAVTTLYVGGNSAGAGKLKGHLKQLLYVPRRVANGSLPAPPWS